ncbi:DNA topoisomerase I [Corchorus olitorius]|uniref:DNA topoisomerase I n=1 Tax=Corchorus olitorius TaxID=93759 RepID=A0A1R3KB70_9ROSI|nr:DNA topoisomerase I [Corchorus olitorius]
MEGEIKNLIKVWLSVIASLYIIFGISNGLVRATSGLELEQPSDEPYLATSLQDFWGRRWNLVVTNILRQTIYKPVRSFSDNVLGPKWGPLPAVPAAFVVSGLMHELLFYYVTRVSPSWEVTWYFVLHGVCVVVEFGVKRVFSGNLQLHWAVSAPLTVGFVVATAMWLFFPPVLRTGAVEKVLEEFKVFLDFAKVLSQVKFRDWIMAVEAPAKSVYDFDDDDDDGPVRFKRSNTSSSKQNQLNSELKKASSQRSEGQSVRQVSDVRSPNGQTSNVLKNKTNPSSKSPPVRSPIMSPKASPPVRSPIMSPKASTSSSKASAVKSPVTNSKASASLSEQSKQIMKQNMDTSVKEERSPTKDTAEPKIDDDDDDDDDDKPLSSRLKVTSNQGNKGTSTSVSAQSKQLVPKTEVKVSAEDSDDDAPVSTRLKRMTNPGTSNNKPYESDEKKPFASKIQQNGSMSKDKMQKSSLLSGKRPLDKGNSSDQSSAKKPKVSGTPTTMKTKQVTVKAEKADEDDDHIPIAQRMKKSTLSNSKPSSKPTKVVSSSLKKINKKSKKEMKSSKYSKSTKVLPNSGDGQKKWSTLVHNGVIFPPPYKPHGVKVLYNGRPVDLTPEQEEVATMYAVMKDTDYMNKEQFKKNFWEDWSKILGKNHIIKDLKNCDFDKIYEWHLLEKEKKKQMSAEEKKALKEEKLKQEEKYMWAIVDGVKEKVGNFRVEPPGLFRGRGEHPKMGKLKKRIRPSDITINIGKDAPIPECPIPGERWKEIKHDNTVTWLAFWNDPINPKEFKYVFLAASSSLKGQSDKEKYEKARMLKGYIKNIRAAYTKDFTTKDVMKRQIAVATYLIDKLALRAGNEKVFYFYSSGVIAMSPVDVIGTWIEFEAFEHSFGEFFMLWLAMQDDDEADTVGCCTLKVGNVECIPPNKLKFDFLGKDSIQYVNTVEVELPVYKAIGQFQTGKSKSDDLFDKLDTSKLNAHLKELMPGLTAKVFRTYNASITLDEMLNKETKEGDVTEKVAVYQRANKEVAIICNHQRSVSKSHGAQISKLTDKIKELKDVIKELKIDLDRAKKGKSPLKSADGKQKRNLAPAALEKKIAQTNAKIEKFERDMQIKEDLKTVALGTSKINYLDPRISVAWCKRHEVPIEKIFNKSLLAKFAWAMDVDPDFRF